jgi:phosphatidylinositol alpha-1,6-mannosyltransferase
VPYYLLAHGTEMLVPLYGNLPAWRRQDFAEATRVLANSRATADLAVDRLGIPSRPIVVGLPVGPRPSSPALASRVAELRSELGGEGRSVLLTVGRLVARKGIDLVLRSVAALRAEHPGLTCIVAGDGPERPRLDALIESLGIGGCVRMLGQVDEVTKWALYEVCDLFVMPNRQLGGRDWEGFGLVFLEAALCARPSIGGSGGGVPDAIEQDVTGLLIDPEEPGALTGALRRLLADPALRRRMGEKAQVRAQSQFAGDAVASRLRAQLEWN